MLYCHCCWQSFFLLMNSQFCCEIRQLWWNKFIKLIQDQIEFDKIFDERNIYHILSKERPGAYGISLNLRGALIREGALLREGSLQNYSGNHCENHQTQYNKSFEYFSLTINYQLFTNEKSEIKYTHDNVVFFLCLLSINVFIFIPVWINNQIWVIFDVQWKDQQALWLLQPLQLSTVLSQSSVVFQVWNTQFRCPVLTKHSNELI